MSVANTLIDTPSVRYVTGHPELGQSPSTGFDCSGFVRFVLTTAGLHVPDFIGQDDIRRPIRYANDFWDHYGVTVHAGQHAAGDLIFFSRHGAFPTHVGIVRDTDSYIHAPGRDGTTVELAHIEPEVITAKGAYRQLYTRNPIGYKSPVTVHAAPSYRYHQRVV